MVTRMPTHRKNMVYFIKKSCENKTEKQVPRNKITLYIYIPTRKTISISYNFIFVISSNQRFFFCKKPPLMHAAILIDMRYMYRCKEDYEQLVIN